MMHDKSLLAEQIRFTDPDYVLFTPQYKDYESDNVHLHVIEHPKLGGLIAFWTQSSMEGTGDNHAMMSKSLDGGKSWSEAKFIIGARPSADKKEKQAHWAFPAISKSGRIYLFYYRETDEVGYNRQITGIFSCVFSDDIGESWSDSYDVPLRITPFDRNGQVQNNCCYQMPRRFSDGRYLFGYSKYTDLSSEYERQDSHIYFARLENIDDDPLPCDLIITNLPDDENGITVPAGANGSVAQEPSIAELPDGRLICTLRNIQGSVYYTVSSDMGHTWRVLEPMCFDDGSRIVHPLSPCPIYRLNDARYILLFHGSVSEDSIWFPRNPIRKVYGTFSPDSHQPIRFKKGSDEVLMTLPEQAHAVGQFGLAMYGSHTKIQGRDILWYPDRKFFLLGKEI